MRRGVDVIKIKINKMEGDNKRDVCPECEGVGKIKVWNGSIHDPRDPELIDCKFCCGRGWVVWVDNIH